MRGDWLIKVGLGVSFLFGLCLVLLAIDARSMDGIRHERALGRSERMSGCLRSEEIDVRRAS